jgi:hypothetical protein
MKWIGDIILPERFNHIWMAIDRSESMKGKLFVNNDEEGEGAIIFYKKTVKNRAKNVQRPKELIGGTFAY